jgi:hypothetical protein
MSSVILTGDTSGTLTVSAPLVAGSNTVTLPAATGTISLLAQATAVASTSGTSIDFTGIPSWAKRITVMFSGVSTSGTSVVIIRLGTGATPTYTTSGYLSAASYVGGTPGSTNGTTGLPVSNSTGAGNIRHGSAIITNLTSNTWVCQSITGNSNNAETGLTGGSIALSEALTAIRITTVNGTDTFDAGSINIMYEG